MIKATVKCRCGEELQVLGATLATRGDHELTITVEPCPECRDDAYEHGKRVGKGEQEEIKEPQI